MRFGHLTYEEIGDLARSGGLAVVPTGCTEQQGPHLPVDFDTWLAEEVCLEAAAGLATILGRKAVVLPALPFGPTPEHRGFGGGFIDIPQALHETMVAAVLRSLADQGFARILVWRGCGQHALEAMVAQFNEERAGYARAFLPDPPYPSIWARLGNPDNPGGHADAFATSLALHLRPELVRLDRIFNPLNTPVDWHEPQLDLSRYTATGVIGDPTEATAELGARLWDELIAQLVSLFGEVAASPI